MPDGDPLWLRIAFILLGGGFFTGAVNLIRYFRERSAEAKRAKLEVLEARIVPAYWKSRPDNDAWTAHIFNNDLLNTVLNYGVVIKFSIVNLKNQAIVVNSINVIEPGLSSYEEASKTARGKEGSHFIEHTTVDGLPYLYHGGFDYLFWDNEGYFDLITRSELKSSGYYYVPARGSLPVLYMAYRSFFDERVMKELPSKMQIRVRADSQPILLEVTLKRVERRPYMGSLPEFEEFEVEVPTKPEQN